MSTKDLILHTIAMACVVAIIFTAFIMGIDRGAAMGDIQRNGYARDCIFDFICEQANRTIRPITQ